ncbi:MAG: hybrid sensor histidine kinase/response regulator [Desulfobacterales bacterium]|nr:hybrid sensor histidine kinase/response regulator [Desulfobacterales bacterium]
MVSEESLNVLIVEDDEIISSMLHNQISQLGYQVKGKAYNAIEAIRLTMDLSPNLILMDLQMPHPEDGTEDQYAGIHATMEIMKQCPTPVVILSAYDSPDLISHATQAGAGAYLLKPVRDNDLSRALMIAKARFDDIKEERRQNEELKKVNASKNKILSMIAHDLKNPLVPLKGYIHMLGDFFDGLSKEKIFSIVTKLQRSIDHYEILLNNLMTWSLMQMGKVRCQPEVIDMYKLVQENTELLLIAAEMKRILFKNHVNTYNMVYADKEMVNSIIRNILINALKFTSVNGEINIYSWQQEEVVYISITDNGIGMTPEVIEKIFKNSNMYHSAGTNGEGGTGLGLMLCKEFIERNHGQIICESEPNKGTKFIFSLPSINATIVW